MNSGTMLLLLQIFFLLLVLTGILHLSKNLKAVRLRSWLKSQLMWNLLIDALLVAQVAFLFAGLLFSKESQSSRGSSSGEDYDEVFSASVLVLYILSILTITVILLKHARSKTLKSDQFLNRFGSIIPDMRTRSVVFLAYPYVDSALRVTFVHLILKDDPTSQCFFQRIVLLFYFIYLGSTKPYLLSS